MSDRPVRRSSTRRRRTSEPVVEEVVEQVVEEVVEEEPAPKRSSRRRRVARPDVPAPVIETPEEKPEPDPVDDETPVRRRRTRRKRAEPVVEVVEETPEEDVQVEPAVEEKPTRRRRTRRKTETVEPVVEEPVVEEPVVEEPVVEEKPTVEEVVEEPVVEEKPTVEEVVEEPVKKRRTRRKTETVEPEPVVEEVVEETPEPLVEEQTPDPVEDETPEEDDDPADLLPMESTGNELADAILSVLRTGESLHLMRMGDKFLISQGGMRVVESTGRSTKYAITQAEADAIAMSHDYKEFMVWWGELTWEERVAAAKKEKVEWTEHENARVANIALTKAMYQSRDIRKWRPEYATRKARWNLRRDGTAKRTPYEFDA